jgi:hypothetical protein
MEDKLGHIPAEVKRKVIEQRMKFVNDNAKLIADLVVGKMQLKLLKLDDNLSPEKVMAKKAELEKAKGQLKENMMRHHLAVLGVVPPDFRHYFMGEEGDMMAGGHGGMWPMMMCMMGHAKPETGPCEHKPEMMGSGGGRCWPHQHHHGMHHDEPWMKHGMMGRCEESGEGAESGRCCPCCGRKPE